MLVSNYQHVHVLYAYAFDSLLVAVFIPIPLPYNQFTTALSAGRRQVNLIEHALSHSVVAHSRSKTFAWLQ